VTAGIAGEQRSSHRFTRPDQSIQLNTDLARVTDLDLVRLLVVGARPGGRARMGCFPVIRLDRCVSPRTLTPRYGCMAWFAGAWADGLSRTAATPGTLLRMRSPAWCSSWWNRPTGIARSLVTVASTLSR